MANSSKVSEKKAESMKKTTTNMGRVYVKEERDADKTEIERMRHTLSHVMAAAVRELYSNVKFGIGPAIENGFYYDIDFGKEKISESDLVRIEKKMRGIIARKLEMVKFEASRNEALDWAVENDQDLKKELIEELPESEKITFYAMLPKGEKPHNPPLNNLHKKAPHSREVLFLKRRDY